MIDLLIKNDYIMTIIRLNFTKTPSPAGGSSFYGFMQRLINDLRQAGRIRTSETYASALRSLSQYRNGRDISVDEIDSDIIRKYEAYLKGKGLSRNSSSFYMRILRAAYNKAVEEGMTTQKEPFRKVYTGVDKTPKRAIPLSSIRRIMHLELTDPNLAFARDMFIFSFYTRGMSFIDMAYLKKSDLKNGILTYTRKKTGQRMSIKWENCMQAIIDRHKASPQSPYLLPIISDGSRTPREQYRNASLRTNRDLKKIASAARISAPLTLYTARHSWASAAQEKNIPLAVISECMGHDSETTTRIYLSSLCDTAIDKANKLIINELQKCTNQKE